MLDLAFPPLFLTGLMMRKRAGNASGVVGEGYKLAPRAGLEPATYWLTANRSAD